MVTHTRNMCSAFNPSKAHTHSSEHTHREHTPGAVGSHLCCGARGAVGGSVLCSRAPQPWYWGWRERCTFTPPTYNSCRTWDSNSQPLCNYYNQLIITYLLYCSSNGNIRLKRLYSKDCTIDSAIYVCLHAHALPQIILYCSSASCWLTMFLSEHVQYLCEAFT